MEKDTTPEGKTCGKGWRGSFGAGAHKLCGARKRQGGGLCEQPAMRNGKCRLHGGKSTGIKTKAGALRHKLAITKHGRRAGPGNPVNQALYGTTLCARVLNLRLPPETGIGLEPIQKARQNLVLAGLILVERAGFGHRGLALALWNIGKNRKLFRTLLKA